MHNRRDHAWFRFSAQPEEVSPLHVPSQGHKYIFYIFLNVNRDWHNFHTHTHTWKSFVFSWLLYKQESKEQIALCGIPEEGFEKCPLLCAIQENSPGSSRRPAASRPPLSCRVTVVFLSCVAKRTTVWWLWVVLFVPVNGKKKKGCGWMLVMGKSWNWMFDYHPLCWTEWRLSGGRSSQNMWSCFRKLLLKFTNIPPTATRDKSTHTHVRDWSWEWTCAFWVVVDMGNKYEI